MTIEYTWKILELDCDTLDVPCTHLSRAHWKLTGVENDHLGFAYGMSDIDYVFSEGVSLSTITENDIINLIIQGYGDNLAPITDAIETAITDQTWHVNANVPLPW